MSEGRYFIGPGGKITADPKTARGQKPSSKPPKDDSTSGPQTVPVSFRLDQETHDLIVEISDACERTFAQTVRRAIRLYLTDLPGNDRLDLEHWRKGKP